MAQNKEINPLVHLTITELGELWDRADETPGERVGDLTKGQISIEITRRTMNEGNENVIQTASSVVTGQEKPRRHTIHPIDGSWGMRAQNRRGALIARLRR